MNKMMIIGNLTRDPELRTVGPDATPVCNMTVAVRKRHPRQGGPEADFIRVTAWRKLAENCAAYLQKGSKVGVEGIPEAKSWTRQDGSVDAYIELAADEIEFCDRKTAQGGEAAAAPAPAAPATGEGYVEVEDDELPF